MEKKESNITRYEMWLRPVLDDFFNQMVITMKDVEGVQRAFDHSMNKINEQRINLQLSRDNWKKETMKLREKVKELKKELKKYEK